MFTAKIPVQKVTSFDKTTWEALTDCMPLVYPWAVNSWSTGSHIINTNKTLSSCRPFTSAQPQAVREAFGAGAELAQTEAQCADPWSQLKPEDRYH